MTTDYLRQARSKLNKYTETEGLNELTMALYNVLCELELQERARKAQETPAAPTSATPEDCRHEPTQRGPHVYCKKCNHPLQMQMIWVLA